MVKRMSAGSSVAKDLKFMFQTAFGPSAVQYANPGTSDRDFPASRKIRLNEATAIFKEINATIEVEYNVWDRARKSPEKYGDPLAAEIEAKNMASKRRVAADLYGDGTGVVGTIASATINGAGLAVVTLSTSNTARGHVGFAEYDDHLIHKVQAGTAGSAVTVATGTFSFWRVSEKDRDDNTVTLIPVNTLGAETTVSSWTAVATEVLYRTGQGTNPNLASISDYGTVTEAIAGLESLVANDGRVIHGITMSGATGGSRYDADGAPIDVKHIQRALSRVKTNVGADRYRWKMMSMAPETLDSLIEARETDRRFQSVQDGARGTSKFMYVHQNDSLDCYTTEFVPPKRLYMLPETKGKEKVLEFHGGDFETVKAAGGQDFQLKPSANGGYVNTMVSYLQAVGVIICNHPKAIAVIENFTNS